jgi:hypothetical protein
MKIIFFVLNTVFYHGISKTSMSDNKDTMETPNAVTFEYVNDAVKNMSYEYLVKLDESDIQCDGSSSCYTYATLVSDPLTCYAFSSPYQQHMIMTCGNCTKTQRWKHFYVESPVIQHNCLFCGIDPVDCDRKWFYQEHKKVSICNNCYTADLVERFIPLKFEDIPNYYLLPDTQLINLTPLTELVIPDEVATEITETRVTTWINLITYISNIDNSMQRLNTWLPFTDLTDVDTSEPPETKSMEDLKDENKHEFKSDEPAVQKIMLINCNGGQVAEARVSTNGITVRVVNESIQEYGERDINRIISGMGNQCAVS